MLPQTSTLNCVKTVASFKKIFIQLPHFFAQRHLFLFFCRPITVKLLSRKERLVSSRCMEWSKHLNYGTSLCFKIHHAVCLQKLSLKFETHLIVVLDFLRGQCSTLPKDKVPNCRKDMVSIIM